MDIDFVVTWVDGNDINWQREKAKYSGTTLSDSGVSRYRDWDNLQYWFRGVEKFAPWVHKIYFVTCGHYPSWLNLDNPKLVLVKHSDYIPEEWLPTFSSRTIDMNFHRIKELSEHFVYFNDDMFLTAPTKKKDFFVKGLPCDTAIENVQYLGKPDPSSGKRRNLNKTYLAPVMDMIAINDHFNKRKAIKKNLLKWFSPKYGISSFRTLLLFPWQCFTGFMSFHLPYSYLKSTYTELWREEEDLLIPASMHKFREVTDLNHWVFSYWQLAKGTFSPRSPKIGQQFGMYSDDSLNQAAYEAIRKQKYKVVCVNDEVNDENFEEVKEKLNKSLEFILPEKSSFEK